MTVLPASSRAVVHCLIVATLLLVAPMAVAQSSGVRDDAKFFSADAVQQAEATIGQIRKDFGKDLLVETFAAIPDSQKGAYDPAQKDAFFSSWASERARAAGVNGVYVLICRDP